MIALEIKVFSKMLRHICNNYWHEITHCTFCQSQRYKIQRIISHFSKSNFCWFSHLTIIMFHFFIILNP